MGNVETGYLLLADLTGYTAYLAKGELEHAPVIAGDLLETIVGRLEPPFRLAKFEGDAAFLFVEDGRADASLLLDSIEASYIAFRRRLRSIEAATTCDCNACSMAPRLDLKFFVHRGEYLRGGIAGRDELAGPDVILVHRLLKGAGATAATQGFALFTREAAETMGLDPQAMTMTAGSEMVEHLGTVETYTLDLERPWVVESGRRRLTLGGKRPLFDLQVDVDVPPSVAWAHLTSPSLRPRWEGPIQISDDVAGGRRGVGTTTRCVTGRLATIEEIVDWQPYDHIGRRIAVPGLGLVEASLDLEAVGDKTHVRLAWTGTTDEPVDGARLEELRTEKQAAFERLHELLGRGAAVLDQEAMA